MYPIRIIDNGNKIEKDLAKNWLKHIAGAGCGDDCIHVDA
jgi:type II secretory pathway component PulL